MNINAKILNEELQTEFNIHEKIIDLGQVGFIIGIQG
jgi:hypothetical protein